MRNFLYVNDLYSTGKMGKQKRGRCGLSSIIWCDNGAMKLDKKWLPDTWEPLSCGEDEIGQKGLNYIKLF